MQNIAIIGGGAGGLMAAVIAAKAGARVTLFEQNKTLGKKILASGNGRCNISNADLSAAHYHCDDSKFINFCLSECNANKFAKLCEEIGILLKEGREGQLFPMSMHAKSVLSAFEAKLANLGVQIHTECKITKLSYDKTFTLQNDTQSFKGFEKVLLAAGSPAAPGLGGSDSGYGLAQGFGHSLKPPFAALVQYEIANNPFTKAAGVKTVAKLSVFADNTFLTTKTHDVLFTKYGLSGLAVLDTSYEAAKALQQKQTVTLTLDLFPAYGQKELASLLQKLYKTNRTYPPLTLLSALLHEKIAKLLLHQMDDPKALNPKLLTRLSLLAKDLRFELKETKGFDHAEICGGGIPVEEVEKTTMQSKTQKGLHLCGELLDVAGQRGGYNLHFAWASGYIAGRAMAKN
jgi:predicted Rossmann fold flavoprotein